MTVFVGTLGDSCGVTVYASTLGCAVLVWKMSVNSCIMLLVASPFRNCVRSWGNLIADEISSRAAIIQSSEDVFCMVYLVGRNSIVLETCSPPVADTATSKWR